MKFLISLFCCLWTASLLGQAVEASLRFGSDTTAIGRLISLKMEIAHPEELVVVFPLESDAFHPFELVSQVAKPTKTVAGNSLDEVTYQVRTFEMLEKQTVRLPYAFLIPGVSSVDTSWNYVQSDTVSLNVRIGEPESDRGLESFEGLNPIDTPPDYSLMMILGIIVLIMLIPLGMFLRAPIQRYLHLQQLKQAWQGVRKSLKQLENNSDQTFVLDRLNRIWKYYLDDKDQIGLRSMTTTEVELHIPELMFLTRSQQNILVQVSKAADRVIYAGTPISDSELSTLIWELHEVVDATYQERREAMN